MARYAALIRLAVLLVTAAGIATACGREHTQPSGGRFLVYTRDLNNARQAIWIARLDGTHARLLVRNGLFGAISPDGRWVAYDRCLAPREQCQMGNAPFALFLISTAGGEPRLLARSTSYATWSPRSDRIVALRDTRLISLDLDGNARLLEQSPAIAGWSFSPDGRWVAYSKARQHTKCASDLFVVNARGGQKRRLTRGRDVFPIWGPHWIAFSRYPKTCVYARRIWRIRPSGNALQAVTARPPASSELGVYYGIDAIEWRPGERTMPAGLATEWGDEAVVLDVATGSYRKLSGYAIDLSRDGRFALVDSGGAEGPHTIAVVSMADGSRRVLAHGDVAFPSWNR